jgi:hypothetical protein
MNKRVATPPHSSLTALRGAVGEIVGEADAAGGWDRLVSLWRIFWALDGLMALLWSIVDRIAAGEIALDGRCSAGAVVVSDERPAVAGVRRPSRRRLSRPRLSQLQVSRPRLSQLQVSQLRPAVSCVAVPRVLVRPMASPGGARRSVGMSPVLAVRARRVLNLGWGCHITTP